MFQKLESKTWLKAFFMYVIIAFQKLADVINGCQSQMVHCHEKRLSWTKLAKTFEKQPFTDDKTVF